MQLKNREMRLGRGKVCSYPCQKVPYACFMGHTIPALDHAIRTTPTTLFSWRSPQLSTNSAVSWYLTLADGRAHIAYAFLGDQIGEVHVYHSKTASAFISQRAQPAHHLIPDRRNYWLSKWQSHASLEAHVGPW